MVKPDGWTLNVLVAADPEGPGRPAGGAKTHECGLCRGPSMRIDGVRGLLDKSTLGQFRDEPVSPSLKNRQGGRFLSGRRSQGHRAFVEHHGPACSMGHFAETPDAVQFEWALTKNLSTIPLDREHVSPSLFNELMPPGASAVGGRSPSQSVRPARNMRVFPRKYASESFLVRPRSGLTAEPSGPPSDK